MITMKTRAAKKTDTAPPDANPIIHRITLDKIQADDTCQSRAAIDDATVDKYAELLRGGHKLDPMVVFEPADSPGVYFLASGHHRFQAHKELNEKKADFEVHVGTRLDGLLYGAMSNGRHGLPMSNADKRKAVEIVLAAKMGWSDRKIAKAVGVTHPFVAKIRQPRRRMDSAQVVTVTTPDPDNGETGGPVDRLTGRRTKAAVRKKGATRLDNATEAEVERELQEREAREEVENHSDYFSRRLSQLGERLADLRDYCRGEHERQRFFTLICQYRAEALSSWPPTNEELEQLWGAEHFDQLTEHLGQWRQRCCRDDGDRHRLRNLYLSEADALKLSMTDVAHR